MGRDGRISVAAGVFFSPPIVMGMGIPSSIFALLCDGNEKYPLASYSGWAWDGKLRYAPLMGRDGSRT